jgi:predicted nucleic acid-binding protein
MIFDTDVFIFVERGNLRAAAAIEGAKSRFLSVQTFMELLQGAQNKEQLRKVKRFLTDMNFVVLPLTENIGHRALIYIEQHTLASGLFSGDAIIAATAVENNMELCSANEKHFKCIKELDLRPFRP